MKVITVSNIKGGSAKSTTAIHLAEALSRRGKTLVIDMDMQADLTDFFLPNESLDQLEIHNIMTLLLGRSKIEEVIIRKTPIDIIPATLSLSKLVRITQDPLFLSESLKRGLDSVKNQYAYVVIDTPGSAKFELTSALYSANLVLIPVTPSKWAIRAVNLLLDEITETETLFTARKQTSFLPCLFGASKKHREILEKLKAIEEIPTLNEIPKSESIKTKTEKNEFLKKGTNTWHAFDQLADEVIRLVDPENRFPFL
ncbi:ParA family protein [Leptospira ognonensis]|uniref:ParA family protein n=1 Tax=Leptospira ognonensis TaxID=2484945 RepID=A0A4R9K9T6_9LEPT|nr:ParA family protein [Leptospira ognonensis]TGL62720.1 ParA family protein [Leptospira ognonensis]